MCKPIQLCVYFLAIASYVCGRIMMMTTMIDNIATFIVMHELSNFIALSMQPQHYRFTVTVIYIIAEFLFSCRQ